MNRHYYPKTSLLLFLFLCVTSVHQAFAQAPAPPTVVSPVSYCKGATAVALTATASTGMTLRWYETLTATTYTSSVTPLTTTVGSTKYYVSQYDAVDGESDKDSITVTIKALPSEPTVVSPIDYCQGATASAIFASGTSLLWYSASTGGTGSATTPTPSTTSVGLQSFYVSQTVSGCEGPRALVEVNVNANPAAPTVTTPLNICKGATASALTATGSNLLWYTAITGGTGSSTAPTPSTASVTTTSHYVTQTNLSSGCESARTLLTVNIKDIPTTPTVTSPVSYCKDATAIALTAGTSGTDSLKWYIAKTGGTGSLTAPTPSTATEGTTKYYVSRKSSFGCEGDRDSISVIINERPKAPTVTTPVTYCKDVTASVLSATGTSLKWYTTATGGVGSTTAPTPNTGTAGTIKYYVSQTNSFGCEGPRDSISVVVNPRPLPPSVTSPVNYCIGATAVALSASGSSTFLLWYETATGGTGVATAPTPSTTALGTTKYYVSQTNTFGCEGGRDSIAVIINPRPIKPTVTTPVTYCVGATASALSATGTSLKWYTTLGGTASTTAPTPSTITDGTTKYYVSQTNTFGCEGPLDTISVVVNAKPAAPTVVTPVTYCLGVTASALTATGTSLKWYTDATGGTGSTTAPTPSTATAGTTLRYVTQTNTFGCESERSAISIVVNSRPAPPTVVSPVNYCIDETPTALTATGTSILWYTTRTGGTGSTTAPTPTTTATGTTKYYVSQTSGVGCEGARDSIAVIVNPRAIKPTVVSPVNYCLGATATALTATGTNLKWYTTATGGTGSATAPTPSTTALGTTKYYVSQTNSFGCEGVRDSISVIINDFPAAPTVVTPVTYCESATASALTATGTSLKWYVDETGGTGISSAPTPSTATAGTTKYYVSQTSIVGCESSRATISVVVNAIPAAPTATSPVSICKDAPATKLTATGSSLLWYAAATGGTGSTTAPTPSTAATGLSFYYVSQTVLGCESPRTTIAVNIKALPVAPTVVTPISYCKNTTASPLTATGTDLKWYTAAAGGTGATTAPTPVTTASGTTNYYVTQTSTSTSCESPRANLKVIINTLPTITGTTKACEGLTSALTGSGIPDASTPWTSSDVAIATVSSTGLVTAVAAGSATITYKNDTGCVMTTTFTVNALPTITGTLVACAGNTSTLTGSATADATTPWTSSDVAIATVSSTGVVTAVAEGTATITYKNNNGCIQTATFTVNPLPKISGTLNTCIGSVAMLSGNGTPDVTKPWVSSDETIATVSSTGQVSGLKEGTTKITYKNNNGCTITETFTVNSLPTITGTLIACVDATSKLSGSGTAHATTPWTSSDATIATVSSAGVVTGVSAGVATIIYTNNNGCTDTAEFTVLALPSITGNLSVCLGDSSSLTGSGTADATSPWTSSNAAVATVSSTGMVKSLSVGTTTISYKNTIGCTKPVTFTVNEIPKITGTLSACVGGSSTLTGSGTAATTTPWISSDVAVATVSSAGVVTALTAGTTKITYKNNNGCVQSATFTSSAIPVISGTLTMCTGAGATTTLTATTDPATSNAWTTSDAAIATVSSAGVVTGITAGSVTITYTNIFGCSKTATIIVKTSPKISGTLYTCLGGSSVTLTATMTPATSAPWTSSDAAVATVAGGIVTPKAAGTTIITYTNDSGCSAKETFTVSAIPVIGGTLNGCVGATSTVTATTAPATSSTWSSANVAVATISTTGVVTGVAEGTSIITYTNIYGCTDTAIVTINPLPTITGKASACIGETSTLTGSGTPDGTLAWKSSDETIATVTSSGVVKGIARGTATISYKNSNGCIGTVTFTVNRLPVISGTLNTCITFKSTLTATTVPDATTPWTSSNTAIATISSTGEVTGVSAGSVTITYKNENGCTQTASFTVNPTPLAPKVTTPLNLCLEGPTAPLTATGTSLKWYTASTGGTSASTISPSTAALGTTPYYVSQTSTEGCESPRAELNVIVNPLPVVSISSTSPSGYIFCRGLSITLSATAPTATSYQWGYDGAPITGAIASTVVANETGYWKVTVKDGLGCINKDSVFVQEDTSRRPTLTPTESRICEEGSVLLTCNPGLISYRFNWIKDGAPIIPPTPTDNNKNATEAGAYEVIVTNSFGCIDTTPVATVSLYPKPIKPVIINLDPIFKVPSIYSYYQWYKDGAIIIGANNFQITTTAAADYHVVVTDANGCTNVSDPVRALGPNGIRNVVTKDVIKIYPNPSQDVVNIEAPIRINVQVTDLTGRQVFSGTDVKTVNMQHFADGNYVFRIYDENQRLITVQKVNKISNF